MPKLPDPGQYNRLTPQPSRQIVSYNDSAGVGEAAIGGALTGIGKELFAYQEKEEARLNKITLDDAENKYREGRLALEAEYRQTLGGNAVTPGFLKTHTAKLDTLNQGIVWTLKNSKQKEAWDSFYKNDSIKFKTGLVSHQMKESDRYATDTTKAKISLSQKEAILKASDPTAVYENSGRIVTALTEEAIRTGASKESLEASLVANLSPVHEGVIDQAINGEDFDAAEAWLEKHTKEVMTPNAVEKYTDTIKAKRKTVGLKRASQSEADRIMGLDISDMEKIAEARKIKDPDQRDATVTRVNARISDNYTLETRAQSDAADALTNELYAARDAGASKEDMLELAATANDRGITDPKYRKELESLTKTWTTQATIKTQVGEPSRARYLIDIGLKQEEGGIVSAEDLKRQFGSTLSTAELNKAIEYLEAGGNVSGLKQSAVLTMTQMVTGKKPSDAKKNTGLNDYTWNYVLNNMPPGVKPSDDTVKTLVAKAVHDYNYSGERLGGGLGLGEDLTYGESIKDGTSNVWLPEVEDKEPIEEILRAKGEPVNELTIRLYDRVFLMGLPMTQELKARYKAEAERLKPIEYKDAGPATVEAIEQESGPLVEGVDTMGLRVGE